MTRRILHLEGRTRNGLIAGLLSFTTLLGCSVIEQPPEAAFTQAEAYGPMEQAVSDAVGVLPDFPGFDKRSWSEVACTHDGVEDSDYTNVEIHYLFSEEASQTELVQQTYIDSLREYWSELGYDIHRDEASGTGKFYSLEARRDDGINLWYSTGGLATLIIQSGCVPRSDNSELTYIPPSGGIVPGSEQDTVAHSNRYFPDGVPADQLTTPAIDPFTSGSESPSGG